MKSPKNNSLIVKFGFACFQLLLSFSIVLGGIDSIQNHAVDSAVRARWPAPVTLTYGEFVKRHPKEGWFHVTGGIIDLASATATKKSLVGNAEANGVTMQVEAPLRDGKDIRKEPLYLAVSSEDTKLCEAWNHLHDVQQGVAKDGPQADGSDAPSAEAEDARDAARIGAYATEHPEKVFIARDVEGIIVSGDFSDMRQTATTSTPRGMAEDYVVLKDGTTGADFSNRTVAGGIFGITLVALYWGWRIWRVLVGRRRAKGSVGQEG